MIKSITLSELENLPKSITHGKNSVLYTRIYSDAKAFLPHSLCTLYAVYGKGGVCGIMCLYNAIMTVIAGRISDADELADFIAFSGASAVFAEKKLANRINRRLKANPVKGHIMVSKKEVLRKTGLEFSKSKSIKDFYSVLSVCNERYAVYPYENYYADAFYRKELSPLFIIGERDGRSACAAAVLHRDNRYAIISDVSVRPDFRRRGYGSELICKICEIIKSDGQTPALLCTDNGAFMLYKKAGFKPICKFSALIIKDE